MWKMSQSAMMIITEYGSILVSRRRRDLSIYGRRGINVQGFSIDDFARELAITFSSSSMCVNIIDDSLNPRKRFPRWWIGYAFTFVSLVICIMLSLFAVMSKLKAAKMGVECHAWKAQLIWKWIETFFLYLCWVSANLRLKVTFVNVEVL